MVLLGYSDAAIIRFSSTLVFISSVISLYLVHDNIDLDIRPFLIASFFLSGNLAFIFRWPDSA
ncbi:hypothetical protein BJX70DRAFT_360038 [Aspergillus crustosus]